MASVAGYKVVIRRAGTPLAFANQACSTISLESTAIHPLQVSAFQISSTLRDIWERGSTVTFAATSTGGGPISSTDVENINFLFGRAYFKSTHASVFATGTYVPLQAVAGAHSYTLTMAQDILDDTEFGSAGFRSKAVGLADVQLAMTRWDTLNTFFDDLLLGSTGAYTVGSPIVAEVQTDPSVASAPIARGWYKLETHSRSGDVNSLETAEVNLALASIGADDSPFVKTFSWNDI